MSNKVRWWQISTESGYVRIHIGGGTKRTKPKEEDKDDRGEGTLKIDNYELRIPRGGRGQVLQDPVPLIVVEGERGTLGAGELGVEIGGVKGSQNDDSGEWERGQGGERKASQLSSMRRLLRQYQTL